MNDLSEILNGRELSRQDIVRLLSPLNKREHCQILEKGYEVKENAIGRKTYLRGLIEFSNFCRKDCLYCGIRCGNIKAGRYSMSDDEILQCVELASRNRINGVVLQSGEMVNSYFIKRVSSIIKRIRKVTNDEFRVTLSLGEQSPETYREWFDAGAQRYLLRIETSSEELYRRIHPDDELHRYELRLKCLEKIKETGYQTGTGVMIGLPFQTVENLADDLLFIKRMDIDMVGMGPYVEHFDTPLYGYKDLLLPIMDRFDLSVRMIAVLRIMMPFINIASAAALEALVPMGREFGLKAGANVLMPNLTPVIYRKQYLLYENKPYIDIETEEVLESLDRRINMIGEEIAYDDYGDSKHFRMRKHIKQYQ